MTELLFSLQDIIPKKGFFERRKEIYFVIFGYDPNGKAETLSFESYNTQKRHLLDAKLAITT
jgi:hypothetical protein